MKFFHLADLHIGKQLYQYNLKEDQEFILTQIIEYAKQENPDAILIAGDIYDKPVPSAEAVGLFDDFLTRLSGLPKKTEILFISGNHDSGERLSFAGSILEKHKVRIAGTVPENEDEFMKKVRLTDEFGPVNVYLFPFIKPAYVRHLCKEEINLTYDLAVKKMIERETVNTDERNVIVSHQFYIGGGKEPERSESEIITVGNIDSVRAEYLEIFDYAALGHIHKAVKVGKDKIRYCGSPLSYSVSEAGQQKGILMVELREKGEKPLITTLPLKPLRNVRKLEGVLSELLQQEKSSDFVSILLKDEEEVGEARQRLMEIFDHILEIRLDNSHIREVYEEETIVLEELNPMEIFKQFYQEIMTKEISPEQETLLREIIQECEEEALGCGQ